MDIDSGATPFVMLIDALNNWKNLGLAAKPSLVKTFNAGQSHHCGLINANGKKYVLKVFKHSFNNAIAAEYLASNARLSPAVLAVDKNIALFSYIPSRALPAKRVSMLCDALKKTHQLKPESTQRIDLVEVCNGYVEHATDSLKQWHQQLLPLLTKFMDDPTPVKFCHNDLVKENCLFDGKRVWLIDWEFAQINNPWFDLASIIIYFNLNDNESNTLINDYFDKQTPTNATRLCNLAMLIVMWCDLLWKVKANPSAPIDVHTKELKRLKRIAKQHNISLES